MNYLRIELCKPSGTRIIHLRLDSNYKVPFVDVCYLRKLLEESYYLVGAQVLIEGKD